jgi:S1-C subfamily serine protease
VAVLVLLVLGQAGTIIWLHNRLSGVDRTAARDRADRDTKVNALQAKLTELTGRMDATFDPAELAAHVTPSVFRVTAGDFSGTAFAFGVPPSAGGTYLATNYHVVEEFYEGGGRQVALDRDNKRYTAKITHVVPDKDLALLETSTVIHRLSWSTGKPSPGQPIVVIGAPLGLDDTVTSGVVSALRTRAEGPVIQFDAPINPGNSGGPLIDANGLIIGIARAKAPDAEGIGLAIPWSVACNGDSLNWC